MTPPAKKEFAIKVSQIPAVRVMGVKIRTTMHAAPTDCARLWNETFMPRMQDVPGANGAAYGISEAIDCEAGIFDYWAAVPAAQGAAALPGMDILDLPGGLYAQCRVESLADIKTAYDFIYSAWLPGQTEYTHDYTAPCYEFYPADYPSDRVFHIYLRVNKE